ncbi:MAG: VOC family protein [Gammaproteobacteria bacterium]|nr:MAG: VOC family protein [Gammaproteobacteria bacterium]
MLDITNVNHVGIRISDKARSIEFYSLLGFDLVNDAGFESGHPVIMKHPSGVVLNLLGPADVPGDVNILMDVDEKHTGITHVALTVGSLAQAKEFVSEHDIKITGSFSFGDMSAIFIRDPDRNVIEVDAYEITTSVEDDGYTNHP